MCRSGNQIRGHTLRNLNFGRNCRPTSIVDDNGAALIVALMAMMLMTALGLSLVLSTSTESKTLGTSLTARKASMPPMPVLERSLQDLLTVPDWEQYSRWQYHLSFIDGDPSGHRELPDGGTLDLTGG